MQNERRVAKLEEERIQLVRNIRLCESYKKRVEEFAVSLQYHYGLGFISQEEYYQKLAAGLEGRKAEEWINEYDSYLAESQARLRTVERKIKRHEQPAPAAPFIIAIMLLLALGAGVFFMKPVLTGLLTGIEGKSYTQDLGLVVNESSTIEWEIEQSGILMSARVSGRILGNGSVKIYIGDILLLDNSKLEAGVSVITGLAIGDTAIENASSGNEADTRDSSVAPHETTVNGTNTTEPDETAPERTTATEAGPAEPAALGTIEPSVVETPFEGICAETCSMDLNKASYTLRFEIENAVVELDTITYIIKALEEGEEERVQENATEGVLLPDNISISEQIENVTNNKPELIKEIPNMTIQRDNQTVLDLNEYFSDKDGDNVTFTAYHIEGMDITINETVATLAPATNLTGIVFGYFIANDGLSATVSNIFSISIVGQPLERRTITNQTIDIGNAKLKIEGDALSISYKNKEVAYEPVLHYEGNTYTVEQAESLFPPLRFSQRIENEEGIEKWIPEIQGVPDTLKGRFNISFTLVSNGTAANDVRRYGATMAVFDEVSLDFSDLKAEYSLKMLSETDVLVYGINCTSCVFDPMLKKIDDVNESIELLVKTSDRKGTDDPAEEQAGNAKQGYIIAARPEGSKWGKKERDLSDYVIIKIPKFVFNEEWLEPEYDYTKPILAGEQNETIGYEVKTQRKYRIPLEEMFDDAELSELKSASGKPKGRDKETKGVRELPEISEKITYNNYESRPEDWIAHHSSGVFTICEDGMCDYTALSTWEDAQDANINGTGDSVAIIMGKWTGDDSTGVVVNGWTTTYNDKIIIRAVGGARHDGKWNNGSYRIVRKGGGVALNLLENFITVDGFQVRTEATADGNTALGASSQESINELIIKNMIVTSNRQEVYWNYLIGLVDTDSNTRVYNTIAYDGCAFSSSCTAMYVSSNSSYIYNTIVKGARYGLRAVSASGHYIVKNSIVYNTSLQTMYPSPGTFDAENSATNIVDNTDSYGAGSINNTVVNFTSSSEGNFHLAANETIAIGAGTDLSGDDRMVVTKDIDGETITGGWDVGADKYTNLISISYTGDTYSNGTNTLNNTAIINVTIPDPYLKELVYNWNSTTNYTVYNDTLVLYFNFNNVSELGEHNTTVIDLSVWGNDGVLEQAVINESGGKYGKGAEFDGINDFINVSIPQTKVTWAYWARNVSGDNQWHHYVNSSGTEYVDGALGTFEKLYYNTVDEYISIGQTGTARYFDGQIDDFQIWNRTFTLDEVEQLYFSTLQRNDTDGWHYWINQSNTSSSMLGNGTYTYYVFSKDMAGNVNTTDVRTVSLGNTTAGGEPPADTQAPTYTGNLTNTTSPNNNEFVQINATWTDETALNYTWSGSNFTGAWINSSLIDMNGNLSINYTNISKVTAGEGKDVCYRLYANDTSGNINQTTLSCISVRNTAPTWSLNTSNASNTYPTNNDYVNSSIRWDDETAINYTWFSSNFSGIWINSSLIAVDGNKSYNLTNISQVTAGEDKTVCWTSYANDTAGNLNRSSIDCFLIRGTPHLAVSMSLPTDNQEVAQYATFTINATVTCKNTDCGTVSALARYNDSTNLPDRDINTTADATPMFIIGSGSGGSTSYNFSGIEFPSSTHNATQGESVTMPATTLRVSGESEFNQTSGSGNANYTNIATDNGVVAQYLTVDTNYPFHKFSFKLNESKADVTQINASLEVQGVSGELTANYLADMYVWNSTDWQPCSSYDDGTTDNGLKRLNCSFSDTTNLTNIIDSSNYVHFVVYGGQGFIGPGAINTDYVYLNVTSSGGAQNTQSTTLNKDGSWNVSWTINATSVGDFEIDVNFSSDDTTIESNDTIDSRISIVSAGDSAAPTYTGNLTNTTSPNNNEFVQINITWTDETALNYTWCGNNFTGSWINETEIAMNGNLSVNHTNITKWTAGLDTVGCYYCYANDSSGNKNQTTQSCITSASPVISCVWSTAATAVNWTGTLGAGGTNYNASENYVLNLTTGTGGIANHTGYNMSVDTSSNVNVNVSIRGTNLASGSNILGIGNMTWAGNTTAGNGSNMEAANSRELFLDYDTTRSLGENLTPGSSAWFRLWVDIPTGQIAGNYNGSFTMQCSQTE